MSELRNNSRQSYVQISKKTNIPVSTVFDKIRKLEKKLIKKHITLIDFSKLGFNIKVVLFLKIGKKDELKDFLIENENVNIICRINEYDYYVEAIFENMSSFYNMLEEMERFDIQEMDYHYIEEDLKREGMISDKN